MNSRPILPIALFAGLGLACLALCFYLFLGIRQSVELQPAPTAAPTPVPTITPIGSPTDPDPYILEQTPRYEGRYSRWNIADFPAGWDDALASKIHAYFERMEFQDARLRNDIIAMREEFRDFLATLGPEALPTLAAILNHESDFVDRRFLLYAIGELGPEAEEATFHLRDFFEARREDPNAFSEMLHVISAMSHLENDTSMGTLQEYVARDELDRFRPKLIEALGRHPRRGEAVDQIVGYVDDGHPNVRNKAAQFLGETRQENTLDTVYRALEGESNPVVRQTLLGTVGKIGSPDSIPFLANEAKYATQRVVRLSAARAISRIGTEYGKETLRELIAQEPDDYVRDNIRKWLTELES